MADYTITNSFELPSNGRAYANEINPQITLRSMTTADEMKRLNRSERGYQTMSEVIDDCTVSEREISAYDLCVPDYQYLVHKLRTVTYGPKYDVGVACPYCGSQSTHTLNLEEDLEVVEFIQEDFDRYSEFTLPASGHKIKLRMQTPRQLDNTALKIKEVRKKAAKGSTDPTLLFTTASMIQSIDDKHYEDFEIVEFLRKLPMLDTNYIIKASDKLNNCFGIDPIFFIRCPECGLDYTASFRITAEFFGPSIDL